MPDENLNVVEVEKTECNCPVCKLLKSDGLKKFLAVVLASFIGCSLAILAFAPKKHHPFPKRPFPPCMKMMDRPMPPAPHEFKRIDGPGTHHKEFRRGPHDFKRDFKHPKAPVKPTPEPRAIKAE